MLVLSLFKKVFPQVLRSPFSAETNISKFPYDHRLQNSPYFCVFKYAQAVKQKVGCKAENGEQDWGETVWVLRSSGVWDS